MMAGTSDNFKNYHAKTYLIELVYHSTQAYKYKIILSNFINEKNEVDEALNRKNELNKNKEYLKQLGNIREYEPFFSSTAWVKDNITACNSIRLDHGVWSRNLIATVLLIGYAAPQLAQLIQVLALLNALCSFTFYFIRGGLELMCGIKHAFGTQATLQDRIYFQIEQRYQTIVNDLILWAPINLTTAYFLFGMGGDLLTLALLVADLAVCVAVYYHKKNLFERAKVLAENDAALITLLENEHKKELNKLESRIGYHALLVVLFACIIPNILPLSITALSLIVLLQLVYNLKDLFFEYKQTPDDRDKNILLFKMAMKSIEFISLPLFFILMGLVVMPLLANPSPWMFLAICILCSALFLQSSKAFTNYVESWMKILPVK